MCCQAKPSDETMTQTKRRGPGRLRQLPAAGNDRFLVIVQGVAKKYSWIRRITLFGSRARGDHLERSDYDLAFDTDAIERTEWITFKLAFDDKAPTLHGYDLIWMADVRDDALRAEIQRTGRTVYERNQD